MAIESRKIERIIKGVANHTRIRILELLEKEPELSVQKISTTLKIGYENASDHVRKLAIAGLVMKRSFGKSVLHKLTPLGEVILTFCKTLQ